MDKESIYLISGYCITVRSATLMDGLRRNRLRAELLEKESDPDRRVLAVIYADLVSVSEVEPVGLSIDVLAEMPEKDVELWMETTQQLNPHWYPDTEAQIEQAAPFVKNSARD